MHKCNNCSWLYDEPGAGLINCCGCEELTEERHEKYHNRGEGNCPYWVPVQRKIKVKFKNGDYLITGFNGTEGEIKEYYLNKCFNLGTVNDDVQMAVEVEFLD